MKPTYRELETENQELKLENARLQGIIEGMKMTQPISFPIYQPPLQDRYPMFNDPDFFITNATS